MAQTRCGKTAKISVIVPAYNAETSIVACVESIQRQDYRNIEILVVNDCSPDRTREAVEKLVASDARVKLLNPEQNVGVHGARRLGVSASTGDYIGFVDADDYIASTMYSTLYQRLVDDDSAIAICSAALVSQGRRLPVPRIGIRSSGVVRAEILSKFCRLKFGSGVLWNKLYKREVIEKPVLLELERAVDASEDYIVNFGAFSRARTVSLCSDSLYNYVVHSSNVSAQKGWKTFGRLFRAYVVCLEKYASEGLEFSRMIDELYLKQLHYNEYQIVDGDMPSSDELEHIAASLRRLADANPISIYSILRALPSRYSRLDRALSFLRVA